ncbi:MAG: DUF2905 domain-containing protein [Chloroflexota bacterium]
MTDMSAGKLLIIFGVILILVGLWLTFGARIPLLGKLPGDFTFGKGNFRFYFPLATSILLSLLLTLIFSIFSRLFK